MVVINVVRLKYPSPDDVDEFEHKVLKFCNYYVKHFKGSKAHYLHALRDHLAPKLREVYQKWGIGLGFFSTQASEHGNKLAKGALRFTSGFTTTSKNKFDMHMRDRLVRLLHFPDTVEKSDGLGKTTNKCSVCGEIGHRRTNKRSCTLHPDRQCDAETRSNY